MKRTVGRLKAIGNLLAQVHLTAFTLNGRTFAFAEVHETDGDEAAANAAHLAACWNLVESYGGDPEALRRALDIAAELLAEADETGGSTRQVHRGTVDRLRAALDALDR